MSGENYMGRLLKVQAALNMSQLVASRIVVSPEAFYELQGELSVTDRLRFAESFGGTRQSLLGLPLVVDDRLGGPTFSVEIDV